MPTSKFTLIIALWLMTCCGLVRGQAPDSVEHYQVDMIDKYLLVCTRALSNGEDVSDQLTLDDFCFLFTQALDDTCFYYIQAIELYEDQHKQTRIRSLAHGMLYNSTQGRISNDTLKYLEGEWDSYATEDGKYEMIPITLILKMNDCNNSSFRLILYREDEELVYEGTAVEDFYERLTK
jgi:hypothetical protein